jgi:hypothetical protein
MNLSRKYVLSLQTNGHVVVGPVGKLADALPFWSCSSEAEAIAMASRLVVVPGRQTVDDVFALGEQCRKIEEEK